VIPAPRPPRIAVRRLAAAAAIAAALALAGALPARASAIPAGNWVWYYQVVQPSDGVKFAGARAVVVADQRSDAAAVTTIHNEGALAFRYLNIYWYPAGRTYEGIDISSHRDWEFCAVRSRPLLGRIQGGVRWYSADLNERAMRAALLGYLRSLRAAGYDGVFFDHATDALGPGAMPHRVSTCTADPVKRGATYSDAFARIVRDAAAVGLRVVVNYGASKPLRRDVSTAADRILVETAPQRGASAFAAAFARDRSEDRAARGGTPRYVQELKTTRLGDRSSAFLEWAEGALWRIDLTVNAGDDGCAGVPAGRTCWHYGTFPELTAVERGAALDRRPVRRTCARGSAVRCLWLRHWHGALVVVNMTGHAVSAPIAPGSPGCRVFTDVWSGAQLDDGACTRTTTAIVPPASGRVYTEAP
jgi:hypothetical protein